MINCLCVQYTDVFQNGLPVLKWPEIVEDDIEGPEALKVLWTFFIFLSILSLNFFVL